MRFALALAAIITLAASTAPPEAPAVSPRRCSMVMLPGKLVGVIEDTTPRVIRPAPEPYTSPSEEAARFFRDSLLATATTLMPTAWVRASHFDAATRAELAQYGITDPTVQVIVQARPYRFDCRTIRWISVTPWVVASTTPHYFTSVRLIAREHWYDGVPTFVVSGGSTTPYPRWIRGPSDTLARYTDRTTGLVLQQWRDRWPSAVEAFTRDTLGRR